MTRWKDEFDFERFLRRMRFADRSIPIGIGDDAAVLPISQKHLLFTTDMMVENVHFRRASCVPEWLAHKLLARSVSDIAAMGGTPTSYLVSLALASNLTDDFVPRFYRGLKRAQEQMHVQLVGGDISRSPGGLLFSSLALLGEIKSAPLRRRGARLHDTVWITGTLGRSGAALELLEAGRVRVDTKTRKFASIEVSGRARERALKEIMKAHFLPEPRLAVAQWLAERNIATAAIDLSDGLSTDLNRLCAASNVGAVIHLQDLPISDSVSCWARHPVACALHGGDDYELLFTAPPGADDVLKKFCGPVSLHRIGEVVSRRRGVCIEAQGKLRRLDPGGFNHLRNR
ncbi:MAG: thiamine-phosphate kinase [Acidobacteria bacterium]|nr:thiamine-phosphate kinase [Acidobacteriota bacterium]